MENSKLVSQHQVHFCLLKSQIFFDVFKVMFTLEGGLKSSQEKQQFGEVRKHSPFYPSLGVRQVLSALANVFPGDLSRRKVLLFKDFLNIL